MDGELGASISKSEKQKPCAYFNSPSQDVNQGLPLQTFWKLSLITKATPFLSLDLLTKGILFIFCFLCFSVGLSEIPLPIHTSLMIATVRVFSCMELGLSVQEIGKFSLTAGMSEKERMLKVSIIKKCVIVLHVSPSDITRTIR